MLISVNLITRSYSMPNSDAAKLYIEKQDFFLDEVEKAKNMSVIMMFAIVNTLEAEYKDWPLNKAMKFLLKRAYAIRLASARSHQDRINANRAKRHHR